MINQLDLTDTSRKSHRASRECTFFSNAKQTIYQNRQQNAEPQTKPQQISKDCDHRKLKLEINRKKSKIFPDVQKS